MVASYLKAIAVAGALGLTVLPAMAAAQAPPPPKTAYKAPRDAYGHPDLQGVWTNSSMTRLERHPRYGKDLTLTEEQVRKIEHRNDALVGLGNRPRDPNAQVPALPAECSDGRGTSCNYDAGWTDPGSTVMRVGAQPRKGFITASPDGRVAMRKDLKLG